MIYSPSNPHFKISKSQVSAKWNIANPLQFHCLLSHGHVNERYGCVFEKTLQSALHFRFERICALLGSLCCHLRCYPYWKILWICFFILLIGVSCKLFSHMFPFCCLGLILLSLGLFKIEMQKWKLQNMFAIWELRDLLQQRKIFLVGALWEPLLHTLIQSRVYPPDANCSLGVLWLHTAFKMINNAGKIESVSHLIVNEKGRRQWHCNCFTFWCIPLLSCWGRFNKQY